MGASERNFATFEAGDNALDLAGGLLPKMAELAKVPLEREPIESLFALTGAYGKNAVLRSNEPPADLSLEQAYEWVEESGIMQPLRRSLWSPDSGIPRVGAVVATGGVANWQMRTMKIIGDFVEKNGYQTDIVWAAGSRAMNSVAEKDNEIVKGLTVLNGLTPTEADFANDYVKPVLAQRYRHVTTKSYDTKNGDEIAESLANDTFWLWEPGKRVAIARVASAGILLAAQLRTAARKNINPNFDDKTDPQLFVITDTLPLAVTQAELANPREFQSPFTAARQIAQTAKVLVEAGVLTFNA